jgi:hypothetical protein
MKLSMKLRTRLFLSISALITVRCWACYSACSA